MSSFSGIKNTLLAEQVEEQLYEYITKLPLKAGDKLPNEFKLAEMFGVGRSTVREAVKLLVSRNVLETRRGSGTYVKDLVPTDLDPLNLRNVEDKVTLAMNLVDLRLILEPGIAELAAYNATDEEIEHLKDLCDTVEYKIEHDLYYIQDDIDFHTYIARCSKNKVVEQIISIIETAVLMFVNLTHRRLRQETIITHRAITKSIAEHDPVGARSAMTLHISLSVVVFTAVRQRTAGYLGLVVALHALFDVPAALFQCGVLHSTWLVEALLLVLCLGCAAYAKKQYCALQEPEQQTLSDKEES